MPILQLPPAIAAMFAELDRDLNAREAERAKANPNRHKLTTVMPDGASYRYYPAGHDGRRREVRFCWSTKRNAAGFFLGWREVLGQGLGRRDQWLARRRRTAVKAIAGRRANAFRAKRSAKVGAA